MLASSSLNPALIVVPAFLLALVAFVAVRRRGSADKDPVESIPPDMGSAVAPPEDGVTLPAVERSTTSTDHAEPTTQSNSVEVEPAQVAEPVETTEAIEATPSIKERSDRTRSLFGDAFRKIRGRSGVPQETWDDLEETLLRADIGVRLVDSLLEPLKARVKAGELTSPDAVINALRAEMTAALSANDRSLRLDADKKPNVWLFVGVNGVGKTTTIGKVGTAQTKAGRTVLMAAGDTFRAAAAEQLQTWAERCGAQFVRGSEGGDPASVIFDGIQAGVARGIDLVLGDTAGRLQNKSNLMEELKKVRRVAEKAEGTVNEVLLVIDATTGQNGLSQAREFAGATDVTGVVLTKLDGSAKGGIVFAIETELGIPVKLVGLGETAADLVAFDPAEYVSALFE
ncbi:MAG: signal recognition particle receptor [Actinomycetota bacterium]